MKHIVVTNDLKEADIRPPRLLSRFKDLSIAESTRLFGDSSKLVDVKCPVLDCSDDIEAYEKYGFRYRQCAACESVFVSPRPTAEAIIDYYQHSEAGKYRNYLSHATADARRLHILRSRFSWVGRIVDEAGNSSARNYADIGTGHPLIFDEIERLHLFDNQYSIDPVFDLEVNQGTAEPIRAESPPESLGAVTAFEQLERQFSPLEFLKSIHRILTEGGILFLTTRTISGFDLQVLWDKAPYVFVPEHLNLLSIDGISQLVEKAGFTLLELSTPCQLDVELVSRATAEDPSIVLPRFTDYFINKRDFDTHSDFQSFLQKNRLSSHVRVAAKKG